MKKRAVFIQLFYFDLYLALNKTYNSLFCNFNDKFIRKSVYFSYYHQIYHYNPNKLVTAMPATIKVFKKIEKATRTVIGLDPGITFLLTEK